MAIPFVVFGCVLLLVAALTMSAAARDVRLWQESRRWQSAPGIVLATDVRPQGGISGADGLETTPLYAPEILYRFQVAGRVYEGTALTLGTPARRGSRQAAEKALQRYTQASSVTVWYDPQQPSRNALQRRWQPQLFILACLSLASGLALLLAARQYTR